MKKKRKPLLFLSMLGMELCWFYAWANFLTTSLLKRPFPFPEAIATFVWASLVTLLSGGRGWRVIWVIGLQTLGFLTAASNLMAAFYEGARSFVSPWWGLSFLSLERNSQEWLILLFFLFLVCAFWRGGYRLAQRPGDYVTLCTRFDLGASAFFLLFLIKLLVLVKEGIEILDPVSFYLIFPYFIFALLAIGRVRLQSDVPSETLPGYRGIGLILSFSTILILFSTAVVLLFFPYLKMAAGTGYVMLKTGVRPLIPLLLGLLRFLFVPRGRSAIDAPPPKDEPIRPLPGEHESSGWLDLLGKILGWGLAGVIGLCLLVFLAIAAYYLVRWLFSKTPVVPEDRSPWAGISAWINRIRDLFLGWTRRILRFLKGYKDAVQLYSALVAWGQHSGLPRSPSETPAEYGFRLKRYFPKWKEEIHSIVEAFNLQVYGESHPGAHQLTVLRGAWRRLCSPLLWPSRLRTWFLRPDR